MSTARSLRLAISISPYVMELLRQRAGQEGRTCSNLAAFLVEREIRANHPAPKAKPAGSR